jgi:glycine betaine catabolism B
MLKLRVIDPQQPNELKVLELRPEEMLQNQCLVGRFPNCSLVLDSSEVSRMHGKFFLKDNDYYFTDLASSGGSRLNGEVIQAQQDYPIKTSDMIQIGRFILVISDVGFGSSQKTFVEVTNSTNELEQVEIKQPKDYIPLGTIDPGNIQRWTKGEINVECLQVIDETHDVKTFRFVADPPMLFTYKPGQFLTLHLKINGEEVDRSYSISSTPSRPHSLEITVKRVAAASSDVPPGLVSNWLHDNIKAGSKLKLSGPMGKFNLFDHPAQKLFFISAGSGITPMMSMSRWILDTMSDCDIIFYHCARSPKDIIYRSELEIMSARYPNFKLVVSTTRQELGHSWLSLMGRLDAAMLQLIAPDFQERTVFVCGPNPFMETAHDILEGLDFPMEQYNEESFGAPRKKKLVSPTAKQSTTNGNGLAGGLKGMFNSIPVELPDIDNPPDKPPAPVSKPGNSPISAKPTINFSKSGKEVNFNGDETILEIAESNDVKIKSNCRAGSCGACRKKKLEGNIDYRDNEPDALEEEDKQMGLILTCISYPVGRVVIDA